MPHMGIAEYNKRNSDGNFETRLIAPFVISCPRCDVSKEVYSAEEAGYWILEHTGLVGFMGWYKETTGQHGTKESPHHCRCGKQFHEEKLVPMPSSCVCGEPITLGSTRWNGERWEHATASFPQAGHHPMTE